MILLIGIPSETPVRLLAEACRKNKLPFQYFNQRQQENWKIDIDYADINNSEMNNGRKTFRLGDCKGLYLRPMDQTQVPEFAKSPNKDEINVTYARLFKLLEESTACRIINKPSAQMSNNSKPFQSLVIKEHELDIPDILITSNESEAREFFTKHSSVIYKSVSGTRSIVKQIDKSSLEELHKIKYCPVQFQEFISGFNVRVHVVGQSTFSTKICSNAVDYRYAFTESKTTSLEPFTLPSGIEEKCIRLAHALELPFAGIDLMFADDGRVICFEVNPSPGYSYYESNTGQPISNALAKYLYYGKN